MVPQGNQVTILTVGVTSQATIKTILSDNETFATPNCVKRARVIMIGHIWGDFFQILQDSLPLNATP